MDIPEGAIPEEQFSAQPQVPDGAIPEEDFNQEAPSDIKEQIGAGAEGAMRGVLGPFAPNVERSVLGIPKSHQLQRAKDYPVTAGVGEAAGVVGSAIAGIGEGAVLEKAGQAGAEALNLARPATYAARVGSSTIRGAIETGLLTSSDEAAKMSMGDPDASAESALANVGMGAALGGGAGAFITGAVSPLWKATIGKNLDGALSAITGRLGGAEADAGTTAADLEAQIGKEFDPSIKAVIDGKPGAQYNASILNQTDSTAAGRKFQDIMKRTTDDLGDETASTLGRDKSFLEEPPKMDKYSTGKDLADAIHDDLKPEVDEINSRYEDIKKPFQKELVTDAEKQAMSDQISQMSIKEGWHKAANDENRELVNDVLKSLTKQESVQDVGTFISNLRKDNPYGKDTYYAAKKIGDILRGVQEDIISTRMSPEMLQEYVGVRSAYKNLLDKMESIDTHLKVGRWEGPKTFLDALKGMGTERGEAVLSRLSGENKANVLETIQQFPTAAQKLKDYHINDLISDAVNDASNKNLGVKINTTRLMKNYRNMSPQLQSFIANPQQAAKLSAIDVAMNRLKDPTYNWSNTARTVDKHMSSIASPASLVMELLSEHATGIPLLGYLARQGLSEAQAGARLGLLKMLGSNNAVDGAAFKSTVQLLNNSYKFGKEMGRAAEAVIKPGAQVVASQSMPSKADREKVDKAVEKYQDEPQHLMKLANSSVGHYMPEHQTALSSAVTRNYGYLATLKPNPARTSPLGSVPAVDPIAQARYNRALDIASNPLIVYQHVKDGTLKPSDVQDLHTMYPALTPRMIQNVNNAMQSTHADEGQIPYKTRMGLSLLLGTPVDNTMTPMAIQAMQPIPQPPPQPPNSPMKGRKGKGAIDKASNQYNTPNQAAERDKANRD